MLCVFINFIIIHVKVSLLKAVVRVNDATTTTHSVRVEGRLVGGQCGEVGGHASCRGRVRVRRAVHGQRHAGRQPLVVKKLVLTRANGLPRDGVLEYRSPGVAAAGGGGGRARTRRAARAARPCAHPRLRRRRTVGGCRYGAL